MANQHGGCSHTTIHDIKNASGDIVGNFFGVFDGHGGEFTSRIHLDLAMRPLNSHFLPLTCSHPHAQALLSLSTLAAACTMSSKPRIASNRDSTRMRSKKLLSMWTRISRKVCLPFAALYRTAVQ